jgi:hypothetical protein
MDQLDKPVLSPEVGKAGTDVQEQLQSMQMLTRGLLVALLWLSAAAGLYLYRQVTMVNHQVAENARIVAIYTTNDVPRINWFLGNLAAFSKSNSDFVPILRKYNINQTDAPPPAAAPGKK